MVARHLVVFLRRPGGQSQCYGAPETMRRAFVRALGVAPAEYRRRFTAAAPRRSHPLAHPV